VGGNTGGICGEERKQIGTTVKRTRIKHTQTHIEREELKEKKKRRKKE